MRSIATLVFAGMLIALSPPGTNAEEDAPSKSHISRIERDDDAVFENGVRIDFQNDPAGAPIGSHANISRTFIPLGVAFDTSFEDSHVAAIAYRVRRSRKEEGIASAPRCAANADPLYQGTMTIRFCEPGEPSKPAGVKAIGFWIGHVIPFGTILAAYDNSGNSIGEITAKNSEVDFLGIASDTPIAFVKIRPTSEDSDFAIDDLVFSNPLPMVYRGDLAASGIPLNDAPSEDVIAEDKSPLDSIALEGRWDVTVHGLGDDYPSWFEFQRSGHKSIVGGYVGEFGSVRPIGKVELGDDSFSFVAPPQWEKRNTDVEVEGKIHFDGLRGTITGDHGGILRWEAHRAPALNRKGPAAWGEPIELFNGADLSRWKPRHSHLANGWKVIDGILTNAEPGNDLVTEQSFDDFKLQAEFRYPEGSNSGIYLRGRYEVQIEDNFGEDADSHKIGGVYGFLTPCVNAAKPAGEWQSIDLELVGRRLTVVLNGERIIDRQIIPGITGGALDSNEGEPGPLMIQGDHGPVEFRKLTLTPAAR